MAFRTFLTLATVFVVFASARGAAEPEIKDLPLDYRKLLVEMVKAFNARDFETTLKTLDQLDKIRPPTTHTLNTRAAIAIERHQWDEGLRLCKETLKIDPGYFPAKFNIAEIPLMQGKYAESRMLFEKLLEKNPREELVQYRIFLTHLLEKNDTAAREALGKIKFPSDTPAFYYANAAWEFAHGNTEEGKAWVARGNWVFGQDKVVNFSESLVQLGWIERPDFKKPATEPAKPAGEKAAEPSTAAESKAAEPVVGAGPATAPK